MDQPVPPAVIPDSHRHLLHSDLVGEDYQLSVWLPPTYESSDAVYPAIYALDGSMTFGLAAQGAMMSIFGDILPEVLVIAIGRPGRSAYEPGPSRARDYAPVPLPDDGESGHAATFVEALQAELLPFIDRIYRTDPADRTLWGHSMAGAFALHVLLEGPGLFSRTIATSPAVIEQGVILLDSGRWPAPGTVLDAHVFTSVGSADDEYRPGVENLHRELRDRGYPGLQLEHELLPGYGHIAAAPVGYLAGLRAVFAT
jgi:predicted alpha/beta superfamily hydrolase